MSAKQIDEFKVVLGQMIKVQNQDKRNLQCENYIAVQVEDEDGENERCLLFTEIQLADMPKITSKLLQKNMVAGRLYSFVIGRHKAFVVKMFNRYGDEKTFRISPKKLQLAQKRAVKNPQDLTKKSWLTDLAD